MSNVDLHPEDLLDKEMLGELSAAERVRLDAHLAVCKACRYERMARNDFRLELEETEAPVPEIAPVRRQTFRLRVALLVAAALLLVSAVAGAGWVGIQSIVGKQEAERPPPPVESAQPARSVTPVHRTPVGPVVSAEAPEPESEPSAATPVAEAAPREVPVPVPVEESDERAVRSSPTERTESSEVAAPSAQPASERTAAWVFAEANRARASGDYPRAIRLYQEVQSTYPASAEARTSRAILGRLLLDRGDADGALRQYDEYASGGGALREEALVGRARALQQLGKPEEEAAAWRALLSSYPSSVHAATARKRLAEIGGP